MNLPTSQQAIGIFDSGLGGISVLHEIHRLLPAENLIYVADSAHAPYGSKSTPYIQERSLKVASFLLSHQIKALVVACNTATAHAVECLRGRLPVPVIGMEPAVKPAVRLTRSGVIGVMATQQTIQSTRLQRLIQEHAGTVKVIPQACPGLVEHVEAGDFSSEAVRLLLHHYTQPLLEQQADVLVLGCTHYPFLTEALYDVTHGAASILETSTPVTHQLIRVLEQLSLRHPGEREGQVRFFSSRQDEQHTISMQALWRRRLQLQPLPPAFH